jgi:L-amino acid N-acyltransferase YncA
MHREVRLKDEALVVIRSMRRDDIDRSIAIFETLSPEDRAYLRRDVSNEEVIEERIRAMESGHAERVVALVGDRIVADAALEYESLAWKKHVAEVRLIVTDAYQRKGLGMLLARELYSIATDAKVEEIVVRIMRPQIAARSIFRKLGFQETVLPDYVKDLDGHKQDLILMRCDLQALSSELDDVISTWDWQRTH